MEDTRAPHGALGGDRIVALRDSEVQPLIDEAPSGALSPSRSLLVERFDLEPTDWQTHVHMDQILVLYLKSARVQYETCDRQIAQIQLSRGQFVICKRNHPETLRWLDPASLLCVQIGDAALNEAAHSLLKCDRVELRPELRVTDVRVTNLLYALEAERAGGYLAGDLFTDSLEAALAGVLVTSIDRVQNKPACSQGGLAPRCLRRVLDFLHDNIDKQIRLRDVAAVAGMSGSHFLQQFRKSMNTSPYKYALALRIEQGKRMLANRHLSIIEVAQAVGFDNPQHFATVFRRIAGVSPSSYRRQL